MGSIGKNIFRYFSLREAVIFLLAVAISITAGISAFLLLKKDVVINNDGNLLEVKTMKATVQEALEENGVNVSPEDYVSRPLNSKLQRMKTNEIYIKKAVPVSIIADGTETKLMTYKDTVREVLESSSVKLSEMDKLDGVNLEDKITSGMQIKIIRVKEEMVTEKIPIPYNVIKRQNDHMDAGIERTIREGTEGIREKIYKVVFEDGKEVVRQLVKDVIAATPIDKVVEFGTVLNYKTARGDVIRYTKVLDMRATAYTASFADTGKHPDHPLFGITATGTRAKKGTIAVDPSVIPLGTRVYVEVAGNTPDYGFAVAEDTGGAIKGDLIDLYFDDPSISNSWGCKRVKVYILSD